MDDKHHPSDGSTTARLEEGFAKEESRKSSLTPHDVLPGICLLKNETAMVGVVTPRPSKEQF